MPAELADLIDYCETNIAAAYSHGTNFASSIQSAGSYLYDYDSRRAGLALLAAATHFRSFREKVTTRYLLNKYYIIDTLNWINDYWPEAGEPYELSMGEVLAVMLVATPQELEYFIGIVDAYRQSLWNKPFNPDFFAALARGFEQWG